MLTQRAVSEDPQRANGTPWRVSGLGVGRKAARSLETTRSSAV